MVQQDIPFQLPSQQSKPCHVCYGDEGVSNRPTECVAFDSFFLYTALSVIASAHGHEDDIDHGKDKCMKPLEITYCTDKNGQELGGDLTGGLACSWKVIWTHWRNAKRKTFSIHKIIYLNLLFLWVKHQDKCQVWWRNGITFENLCDVTWRHVYVKTNKARNRHWMTVPKDASLLGCDVYIYCDGSISDMDSWITI